MNPATIALVPVAINEDIASIPQEAFPQPEESWDSDATLDRQKLKDRN